MALKPKHRREIRDLLRVLYDDKAWMPVHTDRLIDIVRKVRSDVAEEIESTAARTAAEARKMQAEYREKVRQVDAFREQISGYHAQVEALLGALVDMPLAKALVKNDDGTFKVDHSLIDVAEAKVALSAAEKILKVSGALQPPKIDVEVKSGSAFELLDAVVVEEESE